MSYCINPQCPKPHNSKNTLFCQTCGSELLLNGCYRVNRLLSDPTKPSGFGTIYEVDDNGTLKILKILHNTHPKAIELFQQEAEVLNGFVTIGGTIGALIMLLASFSGDSFPGGEVIAIITSTLIVKWLYFAYFESSDKQATLGKMALGVIVCDLNQNRLSFAQASIRYWSKTLSAITVLIGFLMAGLSKKKQALHDKIADTLVIKK